MAPFYADWTFWSFVVAGIAVVLSQVPPLRVLFRRGRLDVDVHDLVHLGHELGHTNLQLVIGLRNTGGREVRVKRLSIELRRDGASVITLPARSYFESTSAERSVLFLPFSIAPGTERWYNYWFFPVLDNADDRALRQLATDVAADIRVKFDQRKEEDPDSKELVQIDGTLDERVQHYFRQRFKLLAGEYEVKLAIETGEHESSVVRTYRFALFESDVAELTALADDYKFGFGIGLKTRKSAWVSRQLSPT